MAITPRPVRWFDFNPMEGLLAGLSERKNRLAYYRFTFRIYLGYGEPWMI